MGVDLRPVLEAGEILFGVGHASDCRAEPDSCAALAVTVSDDYQPACQVDYSIFWLMMMFDLSIGFVNYYSQSSSFYVL